MILIDHLVYRIYRTYERIHKLIKLYQGPVVQSASTVAVIPAGAFFVITVLLGVWKGEANVIYKFMSVFFSVLLLGLFTFIFEKRIRKIKYKFRRTTVKNNTLSIIFVNAFLLTCYFLFIRILISEL